jgi:hypothetical protein
MSNTLRTPTELTREAQRILHAKLNFVGNINRQYDDRFAKTGAKIGSTLQIRMPNQYTVRTGTTMNTQDTTEEKVDLTVATMKGVDLDFTSQDLTLSLDDFSERILEPAMSVLASSIEADVLQSCTKEVYNLVGTAGTTPNDMLFFGQARQKLNEMLAPKDKRKVMVDSATMANMVDALQGNFHAGSAIAKQYHEGFIAERMAGFDWYENDSIYQHTTGTRDNTTPLTNAVTAQTGSSLICDGFDSSVTITVGDVFTIAGVYDVHPETKVSYRHLKQFTVTALATCVGSDVTLSISPSIVASGATQNVSNGAANDKALTFVGSASTVYGQNLAFHPDFATFVTADLELPKSAWAAREVKDGISMRIWRGDDITNSTHPCRIDVLYGFEVIRPQLAVRITT